MNSLTALLLGPSVENLSQTPDAIGFFRRYHTGMIYWSPASGAHEIHGEILAKWSALGFERGFLGYPVSDETGTPDGVGRFNRFQGGMIYWTPATDAHEIHGAILAKWTALGFERGFLGFPVTDETGTPDGVGRFNRFQGGMIYWTPATDAHEVHGAILEKWSSMGFERSSLGYPISDEAALSGITDGRVSDFQNGSITFSPGIGTIVNSVTHSFDSGPLTCPLPLGGSVQVIMRKNGNFTFTCHAHDSGFDNIEYVITAVVVTPGGKPFTFQHAGHTEGTVAGLPFGTPRRDDSFVVNDFNGTITTEFDNLIGAKLFARIDGTDTLVAGLGGLVNELLADLEKIGIAVAIAALVTLLTVGGHDSKKNN